MAHFIEYDLNSLCECTGTLNWFYSVSGLKISVDKIKVVQLGVDRDNRIKSQFTYNLYSRTQQIIGPGIEFDLCNSEKITDLNIEQSCLR